MPPISRGPIAQVFEGVHDRVYTAADADLVRDLAHALERPTIARLTKAPVLKTITRWSLGRDHPAPDRLDRLRHAAMADYALLGRFADVLTALTRHASE